MKLVLLKAISIPITEKGVQQAKDRRAALKTEKDIYAFDLIVVSPMRRTLETFSHVMVDYIEAGVPVIAHPIVREQFSESDDVGRSPIVIKEEWKDYKIDWSLFADEPEVWWYAGDVEDTSTLTVKSQQELNLKTDWEEEWSSVMHRASEFERWLRGRKEENICVISHGGFIEALVGPRMGNAQHCILNI